MQRCRCERHCCVRPPLSPHALESDRMQRGWNPKEAECPGRPGPSDFSDRGTHAWALPPPRPSSPRVLCLHVPFRPPSQPGEIPPVSHGLEFTCDQWNVESSCAVCRLRVLFSGSWGCRTWALPTLEVPPLPAVAKSYRWQAPVCAFYV